MHQLRSSWPARIPAILALTIFAQVWTVAAATNPAAPAISLSTYLGGSRSTVATGVALDGAGNVYVAGWTESADLPVVDAFQGTFGGNVDAFVAKLDPTGSTLLYCTFLGGSGDDRALGLAVDSAGNAYITGWTYSMNFPTAWPRVRSSQSGGRDAYVAKLSPWGSLVYSTYVGGQNYEAGRAIAVDTHGNAYVAGETVSTDFPTFHPLQAGLNGFQNAFVVELDGTGALVFSTYLGGSGYDGATGIAVDANGAAFVTGGTTSTNFPILDAAQSNNAGYQDAFVAKLNPYGGSLAYSTYLGGGNGVIGYPESGAAIDVDAAGNAYVAGTTSSVDFPVRNALQSALNGWSSAFVSKLNPAGSILYSTYLGGSSVSYAGSLRVDGRGMACVAGYTAGLNFPVFNSLQAANAGYYDAFLSCLVPEGNALTFSSYLGGSRSESATALALDGSALYVAGETASADFPLRGALQGLNQGPESAFLTRITPLPPLPPSSPALSAPVNFVSGISLTPSLSWSASIDASTYAIYLGTTFPPPLTGSTGATSYSPASLAPSTTYYWRVVATNISGSASSPVWSFTTQAPCSYAITPNPVTVGASGGAGSLSVAAGAGCSWTATSNAAWVSIVGGASGSGNGVVSYSAGSNAMMGPRSATVTVAGQTIILQQSGDCRYTLSSTAAGIGSNGGSGSLTVTTSYGCSWAASSDSPWLGISSGFSGNTSATIVYRALANSTAVQRNASLTIGGLKFTLIQQPPVGTNTEAFVRQLYLDILSRTAENTGLNTWVDWIDSHIHSRAQVASLFFQSPEFSLSGSYITKLYLAIMLRDPDYGGWNGWFNYLRAGHSQSEILNQFLGSVEFQLRYGNLDNAAFVTLAYNNVLNRAPDAAGLAQWVAWLNAGVYTRAEVINGFITSAEFDLRVRNRVYANMLYIGFLRRAGESTGLDGWTRWLNDGTYTLDQVVGGFISSPEYLQRF